jgi:hypothetical protein
MTSMRLSLMLTPSPAGSPTRGLCALGCHPVDLLDFVHQVLLQLLLAQHPQNVVQVARTVHQPLAGAHALALVHVHVHAARQRVLPRLAAIVGDDDQLALTLDDRP